MQVRSEPVLEVPHDMMATGRSAWIETDRSAWTVATVATEFHCAVISCFVLIVVTGRDKHD
jgi:hypothetical protein